MSHLLNQPILLLREGTDTSQGKPQILSNIGACQAVVDILKTTLGPRGMDKLIYDENQVSITNDGYTILKLLNIIHPAALTLVNVAKSQDEEVGDGTTSVVLLAGELLQGAKTFIEDGMAPQVIIKGYRAACELALEKLKECQIDIKQMRHTNVKDFLLRCAGTALNSKLLYAYKSYFSEMVVEAVSILDENSPQEAVGIKKVTGGSCSDSQLIKGVAFKKTFSYAGFEQQPKQFKTPKILLLNLELELRAEKENAEIRLSKIEEYKQIVDAEWSIIYEKLDNIVKSGAQVILSRLPIGDLATQYFADRHLFCAGRVEEADMKRTAAATGASVQTTVNGLDPKSLGSCGFFEEVQIGEERYNIFKECPKTQSATIILRGGAKQFIDEAERSLTDALMIVRRASKSSQIVGGAGSIEMILSRHLRAHSRLISGKQQLVMSSFAKSLECIPATLAKNCGFDTTGILNKLRQMHAQSNDKCEWYGVDCYKGGVCNANEEYIWEPAIVKSSAISAAVEAACVILSVDETISVPNSMAGQPPPGSLPGMKH